MQVFLLLLTTVTLGGSLNLFQYAYAWDAAGHEVVATLAQIYLHPSVLPIICDLLDVAISPDTSTPEMRTKCHLASVATWADDVRPNMTWSSALHYINPVGDHPRSLCLYPGTEGWNSIAKQNVLDATHNVTDILAEWSGLNEAQGARDNAFTTQWRQLPHPGNKQKEAFKFLVHFLGDMHQPLHLTGRDRGGNNAYVSFEGRETSLHHVWDDEIPDKLLRMVPINYTEPLPDHPFSAIPSTSVIEAALNGTWHEPFVRRILWEGINYRWESESQIWTGCPIPSSTADSPVNGIQKVDILPDGPVVCPYAWTKPVYELNCEIVWPVELNLDDPTRALTELDNPEYFGVLKDGMVIEKLMAQGGLRLAGILNWLLAAEDA